MGFEGFFCNRAFSENVFRFESEDSVLNERDIGIAGDMTTVLTPESQACRVNCLQSCPWTASGFAMELQIDGERIPGREWTWLPNVIRRTGKRRGFTARSLTVLPPERRGFLLRIELECGRETGKVPVRIFFEGSPRREDGKWEFPIPRAGERHFAHTESREADGASLLTLTGGCADVGGREPAAGDSVIAVACSVRGMSLFPAADLWEDHVTLTSGQRLGIDIAVSIGDRDGAPEAEALRMLNRADEETERAFAWLENDTRRILSRLPAFESSDPELEALYYRSLVAYSLNRWDNPRFAFRPFYSNGSINGGCMCTYLWDYGGGLMVHPLEDPETDKIMIRAFLHNDLTTSYAVCPLDGGPTGPWYHINQEKIISMIYWYVRNTGDRAFLHEMLDGRTILDWAVFHAMVCDDASKPPFLADYGEAGKSHLELRRGYVYQGVMPDLNARRYMSYMRAYELTELEGEPVPMLKERAEALKPLLATLWDEKAGWYDFIWQGKREKRMTVQMFKFLDSPVIDEATRNALIGHLNENEFLGEYGLHSISRQDPAYDQVDIDNGGGGSCNLFAIQIAALLYDVGRAELATDIVRRCLWWGTRVPYQGDSSAANIRLQREDTPLQADINSIACVQTILFHMCGIKAQFDGSIVISPAKVLPARRICLRGMRLRGHDFSLVIENGFFTVTEGSNVYSEKLGGNVTLYAVAG